MFYEMMHHYFVGMFVSLHDLGWRSQVYVYPIRFILTVDILLMTSACDVDVMRTVGA